MRNPAAPRTIGIISKCFHRSSFKTNVTYPSHYEFIYISAVLAKVLIYFCRPLMKIQYVVRLYLWRASLNKVGGFIIKLSYLQDGDHPPRHVGPKSIKYFMYALIYITFPQIKIQTDEVSKAKKCVSLNVKMRIYGSYQTLGVYMYILEAYSGVCSIFLRVDISINEIQKPMTLFSI